MTEVITYNSTNAEPNKAWLGFLKLANGDKLMVHFTGPTEEAVKEKALAFADNAGLTGQQHAKLTSPKPWSEGSHVSAGKIWIINRTTNEKRRIDPSQLADMQSQGWERGGPRS